MRCLNVDVFEFMLKTLIVCLLKVMDKASTVQDIDLLLMAMLDYRSL